jgi:hypothetical protein
MRYGLYSAVKFTFTGGNTHMTVSQLISVLRTMPQDAPVTVRGYEAGVDIVNRATLGDLALDAHKGESWVGQHEFYRDIHDYIDSDDVAPPTVKAVHISV